MSTHHFLMRELSFLLEFILRGIIVLVILTIIVLVILTLVDLLITVNFLTPHFLLTTRLLIN